LSAFARRNAFPIHDDSFAQSMSRLVESLEKALAQTVGPSLRSEAPVSPEATDTRLPDVPSVPGVQKAGGTKRLAWPRWPALAMGGAALGVVVVAIALLRHKEPTAGQAHTNPKDGLIYVWIPPGRFTRGCSPEDSECSPDEKQAHEVNISKGFWMGQTEVTQEAYQKVTGKPNPSTFKGGLFFSALPVDNVSWNDADNYCRASGGRLPTEAEWEYAARAGTTGSRYGDIVNIAWYGKNSSNHTHEVAQKAKNAWGLYDMLGNVWEWVADWYALYPSGSVIDPPGPTSGQARVVRGGSWWTPSGSARVSDRGIAEPDSRQPDIGFRCAGD
jgi:formylglycine-generating enzyme required for sulfatase activity